MATFPFAKIGHNAKAIGIAKLFGSKFKTRLKHQKSSKILVLFEKKRHLETSKGNFSIIAKIGHNEKAIGFSKLSFWVKI